jgi:hypothetical protein
VEGQEKLIVPPQPNPQAAAMADAEVKDKQAGAAQKAAAADKTVAETQMMTAQREAELFAGELQTMMAGVTQPESNAVPA